MNSAALLQSMFQRAVQAFQGGNLDLAAAECQRMLSIDRRNTAAMHVLGSVAFRRGDHARAVELLGKVVRQDPGRIQAVITLGEAQLALAHFSEAAVSFRKVVATRPDNWEQLYNLGIALRGLGQMDEAAKVLERCRDMAEADALAPWNALGDVYRAQGRLDEALACFEQALRIDPGFSMAQNNLGITLQAQGRIAEAIAMLEKAIGMNPQDPELYYNLGCSLQEDGRTQSAIEAYRRAIALRSDYSAAHWNLSHSLLRSGDFAEGWREYEWRWQTVQTADVYSQPAWTGDEAVGRTIVLWEEQGLGDTIQFIRFAPLLAERGWKVVVVVQKALKRLLEGLPGVEILARGEKIPPFDVHAPLLSLPRLLALRPETIPAGIPYLGADEAKAAAWREKLPKVGLNVGIVWRGSPGHARDRFRSMAPVLISGLAELEGISPVCLQIDAREEELAAFGGNIKDIGPDLHDFTDTAAVISVLDLVIGVDTSVVHLAGALGRPVWVLADAVCDWRWLEERGDSPWYPDVRLFRQTVPGDWGPVMEQVNDALAHFK